MSYVVDSVPHLQKLGNLMAVRRGVRAERLNAWRSVDNGGLAEGKGESSRVVCTWIRSSRSFPVDVQKIRYDLRGCSIEKLREWHGLSGSSQLLTVRW